MIKNLERNLHILFIILFFLTKKIYSTSEQGYYCENDTNCNMKNSFCKEFTGYSQCVPKDVFPINGNFFGFKDFIFPLHKTITK